MHRSKKPRRRPGVANRRDRPGLGRTIAQTAELRPAVALDEPASFSPQESLETDIAPTVLDHAAVGRVESTETDMAPSVLDQVPTEDLH